TDRPYGSDIISGAPIMKTRTALLAALCILASHGLANAKATYISFDPPGSAFTQPVQINAVGTVDGVYADSSGVKHGFLRAADGSITTFDVTGAVGTYGAGINKTKTISGTYADSKGLYHGFLRASDGTVATFDPSGSVYTVASHVNDSGVAAGT